MVALDPGGGINQQGEACGMGFGKTIFGEALNLLAKTLGECFGIAAQTETADEAVAVRYRMGRCVWGFA